MSEETLEQLSPVEKIDPWTALLSPKPYPHPSAVWSVYNLDVVHDAEGQPYRAFQGMEHQLPALHRR